MAALCQTLRQTVAALVLFFFLSFFLCLNRSLRGVSQQEMPSGSASIELWGKFSSC